MGWFVCLEDEFMHTESRAFHCFRFCLILPDCLYTVIFRHIVWRFMKSVRSMVDNSGEGKELIFEAVAI